MPKPPNQTFCYAQTQGHQWMSTFDSFSPTVREALREANINICCLCLAKHKTDKDKLLTILMLNMGYSRGERLP